ncbi:MAG: hypothetical protein K0S53_3146 [Bacteroidetes bacterium]|nr:hypothetical protein [Bacteroidota bacterium]
MHKHYLVIFSFFIYVLGFSQTQTDANGKKQGYWRKKDDKTFKLIYEGLFKDDKPQGIFKYYYPHDTIKAIMNFKQDGKIAYSTMFHPTGKKMAYGKYIGENKDSVWTYYDEKATLISKETFVKGKKDGMEYVYFPDGVVSEERKYKAGVMDGPYKLYYDKALVKTEGVYLNGKLEGKNVFYFPNGVKEKELYKPGGELADKKETDAFFSKNKTADEKPKTTETKTTTTKPGTKTASKPKKNS